jgi:type IV pilus assembly protein PilV
MAPVVYSNKRGFTLIELMVSLVILTVGLLGLLQTINVALHANMKSQMDYIGAMVADQQMAQVMAQPFANVPTTAQTPVSVQRQVNLQQVNYTVTVTGTTVSANTKGVSIQVSWNYQGSVHNHYIYSMVSNYTQ